MRSFDSHKKELMDRPQSKSEKLAGSLRELEFLNRHFGGHGFLRRFLTPRFEAEQSYKILDIGTAGGDFPRAMVDWARSKGVHFTVDAIDSGGAIISLARQFSPRYPEIEFIEADARSYGGPTLYDLVHCSLTLHHFGAEEAVAILAHCQELSRRYVLVTDLERSGWTRLGVYLANTLLRHNEMTVRDGNTSAQRAFSFREFNALAKGAQWHGFGHRRFPMCRQALWLPAGIPPS